jgi:NitT/TauT family transport system permease protein
MAARRTRWEIVLAPYIFTIAFFLIWEIACRALKVPAYFLPTPSATLQAMWQYREQLLFHSFHTLWMTLAGFAIAVVFGVLLGLLLGASRMANAGLYPLLVGFNAIPKVAVVPILILWFGVGWMPPVLTAFLISFFPIVANVATGLSTIEPEVEDVLRALGATRRQILVKVGIPRSMPYLFASLKVSITLAYVGSVIAESNASRYGIGNLITRASADFNVPLVFGALVALAILGVAIYAITVELERRMTVWAHRSGFASE